MVAWIGLLAAGLVVAVGLLGAGWGSARHRPSRQGGGRHHRADNRTDLANDGTMTVRRRVQQDLSQSPREFQGITDYEGEVRFA